MATKKLKFVQETIDKVQQSVTMNKILLGFYEDTKKKPGGTKEGRTQIDMKIESLKKDILFNEAFILYATKQL